MFPKSEIIYWLYGSLLTNKPNRFCPCDCFLASNSIAWQCKKNQKLIHIVFFNNEEYHF